MRDVSKNAGWWCNADDETSNGGKGEVAHLFGELMSSGEVRLEVQSVLYRAG